MTYFIKKIRSKLRIGFDFGNILVYYKSCFIFIIIKIKSTYEHISGCI